jgi:RHH-type transcriptional regulator, rel operon repressor / antitoxin RelB
MSTNSVKSSSSTLSVRVPEELREQLDYLSQSTKRSRAYLAAEALSDYVRRNAWRAKELSEAIEAADEGEFISHEAMLNWVAFLGSKGHRAAPKPDVKLRR